MTKRINFLEPAKRVVAQRAGYRCAFPDCDQLTVGPGTGDEDVENNGIVAHIHSASAKGPRGQGPLTKEQLRHPRNGMWMCPTHASAIDKLTGKRYPADTLQSWKSLHESRIAYEQSGRQATFGYIRQIEITLSPLFAPGTTLELAKATILVGQNGAGKTAICEWLLGVASQRGLKRWRKRFTALDYTIAVVAPIERSLRIEIPYETPLVTLGRKRVPANPLPVAITYIKDRGSPDHSDDLTRFAAVLHLEVQAVEALAQFIGEDGEFLKAAEWIDEASDEGEARRQLICTLKDGSRRPFGGLSDGEQSLALLDFAVAYVSSAGRFTPAMLMVEVKGLGLSWDAFKPYMTRFAASSAPFQTIVTTWEIPDDVLALGWQVYEIAPGAAPRSIRAFTGLP